MQILFHYLCTINNHNWIRFSLFCNRILSHFSWLFSVVKHGLLQKLLNLAYCSYYITLEQLKYYLLYYCLVWCATRVEYRWWNNEDNELHQRCYFAYFQITKILQHRVAILLALKGIILSCSDHGLHAHVWLWVLHTKKSMLVLHH